MSEADRARWDAFCDEELEALWGGLCNTQIEFGLRTDEEFSLLDELKREIERRHSIYEERSQHE